MYTPGAGIMPDKNGNAPYSKLAVVKDTINPFSDQYGCVGDGVTDDTAGWLAANADLIAAGGGTLVIPPNKNLLLSPGTRTQPVRVPRNVAAGKKMVWKCDKSSHFTLSANMRTLFQPGRVADGDTFRNLDFVDIAVDAGSVAAGSGGDDIIFGPANSVDGGSGTLAQRVNYDKINWIRPRGWNAPAGGNGGNARRWLHMFSRHVKTNEGDLNWNPSSLSQTGLTNILIDTPQFDGGDMGICILGGIQFGVTSGARLKNFSGTTLNYTGLGSQDFVDNEWLHVGVGAYWERRHIVSHTNNGDGTGSITIDTALSFPHTTEDSTGTGKGAPLVCGYVCNVWHNDITVRGGYHIAATGAYGSNVQLVGTGIGDRVAVEDFYGKGSGDNGIEVDTALTAKVRRCYIEDAGNEAYLSRNFAVPQSKTNQVTQLYEQVHTYEECTHSIRDTEPTASVPGWGWVPGYAWSPGLTMGATPVFGTVRWRGCKSTSKAVQMRTILGRALRCSNDSSIRRLEGDITYTQDHVSDATSGTVTVFAISPASNVQVDMTLRANLFGGIPSATVVRILDIYPYRVEGQATQEMLVDVDVEARSALSGAGNGAHQLVCVGRYGSSANVGGIHGRIGFKALSNWSTADTVPKAFNFDSLLSLIGTLRIDGCDFANWPGGGVILNFLGTPPLAWMRKLRVTRNNNMIGNLFSWTTGTNNPGGQFLGDGGGAQSYALTVTTGAFVWINETGVDHRVNIYGGTGTDVEHSYNSGAAYDAAKWHSQAAGAFPNVSGVVRAGEALKVTNTVAPTITVTPLL